MIFYRKQISFDPKANYLLLFWIWVGGMTWAQLAHAGQHSKSERPDWSEGVLLESDRGNIFKLPEEEWKRKINAGKHHTLNYPVTTTGALIPYQLVSDIYEAKPWHPLSILARTIFSWVGKADDETALYRFLGLHPHRDVSPRYSLPKPTDPRTKGFLGASLIETEHGTGVTFSCAACHVGNLFGTPILGLTNRFPRANEFLLDGKKLIGLGNLGLLRPFWGTDPDTLAMLETLKHNMHWVDGKQPIAAGLDTSLAQVDLSLKRREPDVFASKTERAAKNPRPSLLHKKPADSKPAVWWNLKYKNRWLSDGSVVSGNPIITNFLWNEIGRGSDLQRLQDWLAQNQQTIDELTATVFATEAPRYLDFLPEESINLQFARQGQALFNENCSRCHGTYEKGWDSLEPDSDFQDLIATLRVDYAASTPVVEVGTDPHRYEGMAVFSEDLNRLQLSKDFGVRVVPQQGYVPPPLVGIWSRWPYLHNNSIPNLCQLLTAPEKRVKEYWAGEALNPDRDFDQECVGYPLGAAVPDEWKKDRSKRFDSSKEGLSNQGHGEGIILRDGVEVYSAQDKVHLLHFLKTL